MNLLIEALKDGYFATRAWAARGLGRLGRPAGTAIPCLVGLLHDPHALVRREAARALRTIEPGRTILRLDRVRPRRRAKPAALACLVG